MYFTTMRKNKPKTDKERDSSRSKNQTMAFLPDNQPSNKEKHLYVLWNKLGNMTTITEEIPPMILKGTRMPLCDGYMLGRFRFRTYVPTSIFDPLAAEVRVYETSIHSTQFPESPEKVVTTERVPLQFMPKWNVEYQCLQLGKRDETSMK